jgi:hypothetical protein
LIFLTADASPKCSQIPFVFPEEKQILAKNSKYAAVICESTTKLHLQQDAEISNIFG